VDGDARGGGGGWLPVNVCNGASDTGYATPEAGGNPVSMTEATKDHHQEMPDGVGPTRPKPDAVMGLARPSLLQRGT